MICPLIIKANAVPWVLTEEIITLELYISETMLDPLFVRQRAEMSCLLPRSGLSGGRGAKPWMRILASPGTQLDLGVK